MARMTKDFKVIDVTFHYLLIHQVKIHFVPFQHGMDAMKN